MQEITRRYAKDLWHRKQFHNTTDFAPFVAYNTLYLNLADIEDLLHMIYQ